MEHRKRAAPGLLATFRAAVCRDPDGLAVRQGGASLSYRELWIQSGRVAKALIARGIGPDGRIGSWSPNVLESVILQCGALRIGAICAYLDPEWDANRARIALERAAVSCVFIRAFHQGRQYPAMIKSVRNKLPHLREMVVHGRQPRFEGVLPGGWADFLKAGDCVPDMTLTEREEEIAGEGRMASPAMLFSGDDHPQPSRLREEQVVAALTNFQSESAKICVDMSFHRPTGLLLGCLLPLLRGAAIVLPEAGADAESVVALLNATPNMCLVASSATARALGERSASRRLVERCWIADDYSSVKTPTTAAAAFAAVTEVIDDGTWLAGDTGAVLGLDRDNSTLRPPLNEIEEQPDARNRILSPLGS